MGPTPLSWVFKSNGLLICCQDLLPQFYLLGSPSINNCSLHRVDIVLVHSLVSTRNSTHDCGCFLRRHSAPFPDKTTEALKILGGLLLRQRHEVSFRG